MKYAKKRERSEKSNVFLIPDSRNTAQTVEKQGRYSMAKAVKATRAGKGSRRESSLEESISNVKVRFSLAKNPAKRDAENGAFPNPRGTKRKEKTVPNKKSMLSASSPVK